MSKKATYEELKQRIQELEQAESECRQAVELLNESEASLAFAQRIVRLGSWTFELATSVVKWSDELYRIFGLDPDSEPPSWPDGHENLYHPDDWALSKDIILKSIAAGEPYYVENRIIRETDGTVLHTIARGVPKYSNDGSIKGYVGTVQDITERKQAEGALRESEKRFQISEQIAHLGSWEMDIITGKSTWSDEFFRICGLDPGSIEPTSEAGFKIIHPDDRERAGNAVGETIKTGIPYNIKKRIVHPNGTIRWVHSLGDVIYDDQHKPAKLSGSFLDITERKQVEDELRESEEHLQSVFRAAPTGIGVVIDRVFKQVNERMCAMTGYSNEELIDQNARMVYPSDEDYEYVGREKYGQIRDHGTGMVETRFKRKDGRIIDVLLSSTPLDIGDLSKGVTFTALDITERRQAEELLKQEKERAESYLNIAGVIMVALDSQGIVAMINRKGCDILGYDEADILGKNWFDNFIPERIVSDVRLVSEKLFQGGIEKTKFFENPVLTRGGEERLVAWHNTAIRNNEGEITGLLSSGEDITDRKKAEDALQESGDKFREMTELLPEIVYECDAQGNVTFVNKAGLKKYGITQEDIDKGVKTQQFLTPGDRKRAGENLEKILRDIEKGPFEYTAQQKDGSEFPIISYSSPIIRDGKPVGNRGICVDITDRKKAEEKLRKSEDKFRLLADYTYDWEYWINEDGKYIYTSPSCQRITGYSSDDFYNNPKILFNLVHPDYAEMICGHYHTEGEKLKPLCTMEFSIINRNGEVRWIAHNCIPVFDNQGHFLGRRGSNRDITERRQSEEAGARLEEQYHQAQKVESIGRLAGGVAHDLNNLLTPILGYSEMLLDDLDPDDTRRESVDEILRAGFRARDLVRQLLAFGRKQTLEYRPVDLNQALIGFEKLLRRTIREDIEIEIIPSTDIRTVMADIGQIEQVIMNLAVNAQDAMPEGGCLTIETATADLDEEYTAKHQGVKPGSYVMLAISDTGCGMDGETLEQVFEPFFSTKGEQGTGLGLATVYGIVKQHGGNIWIYSEPEEGTTVKIYLPVSGEAPVEEETSEKTAAGAKGFETILLVEDNKLVRDLAHAILKRQGYTVLVAEDGPEALTILEAHDDPVDLLLTDVVMPGMNGRDLFDKVAEKYPDTKVLYMSGYTDNTIAHRGVLDEGTAFIQKPFNVQALAAKVREVLDD